MISDVKYGLQASHVKALLFEFRFGFVWVSQDIGDILILQFKQRLRHIMTKIWCSDINNTSRRSTYVYFKTLLNPEKYLSIAIHVLLKII